MHRFKVDLSLSMIYHKMLTFKKAPHTGKRDMISTARLGGEDIQLVPVKTMVFPTECRRIADVVGSRLNNGRGSVVK